MKGLGAFMLAAFILILSLGSSISFHFCQDALVETSITRSLSGCCKKVAEHQQPMLSKPCCEIAHFTAELQETTISDFNLELSSTTAYANVVNFDIDAFEFPLTPQFLSVKPPPKPHHTLLHVLFEQYLI